MVTEKSLASLELLSMTDSTPSTPNIDDKGEGSKESSGSIKSEETKVDVREDEEKKAEEQVDSKTRAKIEGRVLRINTSSQEGGRLERKLLTLHGQPPQDEPLQHDFTYFGRDRRTLPGLTITYKVKAGTATNGGDWQDSLTQVIWRRLQILSPESADSFVRPAIVFDAAVAGPPTFYIVFKTVASWVAARKVLHIIEVENNAKQSLTYEIGIYTNSLAYNILPVDILLLPEAEARRSEFFAALQDMVSPIGSMLGVGLVQVAASESDADPSSSEVIRFYIKLTPASMMADFSSVIAALPTSFRWDGATFKMAFPGYEKLPVNVSANYPDGIRNSTSARKS